MSIERRTQSTICYINMTYIHYHTLLAIKVALNDQVGHCEIHKETLLHSTFRNNGVK